MRPGQDEVGGTHKHEAEKLNEPNSKPKTTIHTHVPVGHGLPTDMPDALQKAPAAHGPHPLAPLLAAYVPTKHGVATRMAVALQNEPAGHAVGADSPEDGQYAPTGHVVQDEAEAPEDEYVPLLHTPDELVRPVTLQYEPAVQFVGAVNPVTPQ